MELRMMNSSGKGLVLPYKAESSPTSTGFRRLIATFVHPMFRHQIDWGKFFTCKHSDLGRSNSAGTRYRGPWDWSEVCYWTVRFSGQSPNACGVKMGQEYPRPTKCGKHRTSQSSCYPGRPRRPDSSSRNATPQPWDLHYQYGAAERQRASHPASSRQ